MPRRKAKKGDDGPSADWLVTFCDCMTLLLAFFVMLLSFSSFDPEVMNRLQGGFEQLSYSSLFDRQRLAREAPIPQPGVVHRTEEGDGANNTDDLEPVDKPRDPLEGLAADAYRDRRVLTVPSEMLFLGRTNLLKGQARRMLSVIADYLRLVPCRVIVSETVADADAQDRGLARTWAVVGHFTEQEGLEADRFGIAVQVEQAPRRPDFKPAIRIAMLSRKVFP